jgi:xanthine dehydrogenase accessory factor
MREIIDMMYKRCRNAQDSMLVTVIAGTGSAPREAGACMLVGAEGRLEGTIGGGMLEYKATESARENLAACRGGHKQYRLSKDGAAALGMVCGGDVDGLADVCRPTEQNKKRSCRDARTCFFLTKRCG